MWLAIIFNIFTVVGITGLFNVLESIESPFDEQGMDDIRLTSDMIQFKNDLKLLFVEPDQFISYEEQLNMESKSK
jgi:hypothetical protein